MRVVTGLSIFNRAWLVEPNAAVQLLDHWRQLQESGAKSFSWAENKPPMPIPQTLGVAGEVVIAPTESWQEFKGFEGARVAVLPISGPLMKADWCGEYGTDSMRKLLQLAERTESVETIVLSIDSPGGSVDGTDAFASAIKNCSKKTVAVVSGMMCSAAYWIGSSCAEVYASSATDIIGSIGTMCAFYDRSAQLEKNGVVLREYYATESKDKNLPYREAIAGDGKKLVQEQLDPTNDIFLGRVKSNRGSKLQLDVENVLTGKTYMAAKAATYGLIDGMKTLDEVVNDALAAPKTKSIEFNIFSNNKVMEITSVAQLRTAYPALVTEVENAAAAAATNNERARIAAWQAWRDVDAATVDANIASGAVLTPADINTLSATAATNRLKAEVENENPADVKPPVGKDAADKTPEQIAAEQQAAEVKEAMKHLG